MCKGDKLAICVFIRIVVLECLHGDQPSSVFFGKKHFEERFRFRKKAVAFLEFSCGIETSPSRCRSTTVRYGLRRRSVEYADLSWRSQLTQHFWIVALPCTLVANGGCRCACPAEGLITSAHPLCLSCGMGVGGCVAHVGWGEYGDRSWPHPHTRSYIKAKMRDKLTVAINVLNCRKIKRMQYILIWKVTVYNYIYSFACTSLIKLVPSILCIPLVPVLMAWVRCTDESQCKDETATWLSAALGTIIAHASATTDVTSCRPYLS